MQGMKGEYKMRERDIESYLVREVKKLGGRAYKWVSPGNDGVPDRIVIMPNKPPVFVELKTRDGQMTDLQRVQLKRLLSLGQDVLVLYGKEDVEHFIKELKDGI